MPRTRAASWSRSWRASSRDMSNTISPRRWKSSSTRSPTTRSTGSRCCAISGTTSSARSTRSRTCASRRCWTRSTSCSARICFPPREDGGDAAAMPDLRRASSTLKAGRFGAFVGCSHYPECRYTRPLAAPMATASGDRVLGKDPETGLDVTVNAGRFGPYVQLGDKGDPKREAETRRPAEGHARPTMSISRRRWACSRCRAMSASIRRAASRSSPASAASVLREARQDLRQSRGRR